jgi:hypothetical protein
MEVVATKDNINQGSIDRREADRREIGDRRSNDRYDLSEFNDTIDNFLCGKSLNLSDRGRQEYQEALVRQGSKIKPILDKLRERKDSGTLDFMGEFRLNTQRIFYSMKGAMFMSYEGKLPDNPTRRLTERRESYQESYNNSC